MTSVRPRPYYWSTNLAALILATLAACGGGDGDTREARKTGKAAGVEAEAVAITNADLPEDLGRCPYSGPMPRFLRGIGEISEEARDSVGSTWDELQAAGAVEGFVTVHTGLAVACRILVSGPPPGSGHDHGAVRRSVTNVVAQFEDEAAAKDAYDKDVLQQSLLGDQAGAVVGEETELGPNSVVVSDQDSVPKMYWAVWQQGRFYLSVKTENLTREEAHAAAVAQHRRAG